jgi:zinc protease
MLLTGAAEAQSVRAPRLHVLENGLRVLTVEDRAAPVVTATWSAHVGDSAEPPDFAGNSHYLEHLLLFRGTEAFPKNEIGEWVASRGGYFNGHTWYDYTTFEIMCAPIDLDAALERHEQMMFHAAFSGEAFETEKKAVFEELRSGLDSPYGYLWRAAPYRMYPEETFYSRSTIGTIETVEAATVERVRDYYESYYVPNNMTLALVGDIDTDEALTLVESRFGDYPRAEIPPALYEPVSLLPGMTVIAEERDIGKAYFLLTMEGPQATSPEYFPYLLLSAYLSDGSTSLLQDELVARRKVLDAVSMSAMPRRYPSGWQGIDGEADPAAVVEALAGIWELLDGVVTQGVPGEELDLARSRLMAAHRVRLDDQFQVATGLVEADAHGDYRLFSDYEEHLARVSAADVHAVARKYLTPDHFVLMAIFPPGRIPDGFEDAVREAAGRHVRSRAGVITRELESGATLLYEARPGSAMESFSVAVRAGDRDGATAGLPGAVAEMMTRRTGSMSKRELQERLDRSGFRLASWTSDDAAFFTLQAPDGSTADAASLLVEVLTAPGFTGEEWEAARNELISGLERRLDQPRAVAFDELVSSMFRDTGYGRSIEATRRGIESLNVEDLDAFWRSYYRAGSMIVAYSGGASIESIVTALEGLEAVRGTAPPRDDIGAPAAGGVIRTARPMAGKTQANLYLAWPTPPLGGDDWILWELAERAIGGDLAGRLWKLRQDEGLAYSVWLSGSEYRDHPLTYVYMATAGEKRERALAAIDREIRRAREGLTAEELERVKVSYLADLDRRDRTAQRRSLRLADWWSKGLGPDHREHLAHVIESASLDEVNRVVRSVLDPEAYYFAEAGAVPE